MAKPEPGRVRGGMPRAEAQVAVERLHGLVPERKKAPAPTLPVNAQKAAIEVNVVRLVVLRRVAQGGYLRTSPTCVDQHAQDGVIAAVLEVLALFAGG